MELNRFLKIVWTINGAILLVIFILMAFTLGSELIDKFSYREPQVIVGEELEEAKKEGLVLQGLEVGTPQAIYNSDVYLLSVRLKTYERPKSTSFGSRSKLKIDAAYGNDVVNFIFLDKDMQPVNTLLDRKAFIKSYTYPERPMQDRRQEEVVQHNISYEIAFEDSNKDGKIDDEDNSDLFITDLTGKNLTQVTNGIDVLSYRFLDSARILINYHKRTDEEEEHKKDYFSLYSIEHKTLSELTLLHSTLDKIESQLTQ
jgi:hypothetical protein